MSSVEEIELLRRFYDAWLRDDVDAALECTHPDMELDWTESMAPFRGVYLAHDGMRRYWSDLRDAFEWFRPEIDKVHECAPRRFVTSTTVRGRARASGIEVEAHGAALWEFRDDKIARGKLFQTTEQALEAARQAA